MENYEKVKRVTFIKKFFDFCYKTSNLKQTFKVSYEELRDL